MTFHAPRYGARLLQLLGLASALACAAGSSMDGESVPASAPPGTVTTPPQGAGPGSTSPAAAAPPGGTVGSAAAPAPGGTVTPPQQATALTTQGAAIVDAAGKEVILHGFSWFGFNNQQTMVDGLYTGGAMGGDFATVVLRMRSLGFNAVRLPFSFADLANLPPRPLTQPCTLPSLAQVAASLVPAGSAPPAIIALPAPPSRTAGMCNDYLPQDSTRHRFIWTVQFFAHNGFYVLIDNHMREDPTVLTAGAVSWTKAWAQLVSDLVKGDPLTQKHLMVDVLNEPDSRGIKWAASGSLPGLADLYLGAMDAINAASPVLFFVEGTGQGSLNANWGDGFDTNPSDLKSLALSDPSAFFIALEKRPYARRLVISPHVYGPAVTTNMMAASGAPLVDRMTRSFGYLTKAGFCGGGGACSTYPIAIGEFGSTFTAAADLAELATFSAYLQNTGAGADGQHAAIHNWFYWSLNPDSGDTGGLVGNDWVTLNFTKLTYLRQLGL